MADNYIITLQVINPGRLTYRSAKVPTTVTTYTQKGKTLLSALKKLSSKVPKKIYTSHLKLLLLGEGFAREGVAPIIDIFLREVSFRANFNIAVAKNITAETLIKTISENTNPNSSTLENTLILSEETWSPIYNSNLYDFVNSIVDKGTELTLPGIELITAHSDDTDNTGLLPNVQISTMCVFKDDKLLGWLDEEESIGSTLISNKMNDSFIDVTYEGQLVSLDFYKTTSTVQYIESDDVISFNIYIKCYGTLNGITGEVDWDESKMFPVIEDNCNRKFSDYAVGAINRAQLSFVSDIFGFGRIIKKHEFSYWSQISDNWSSFFATCPINVFVETKIDRSDKTHKTIDME